MKGFAFSPKSRQRGIAALFVAVILLLAVTLLVMFASRVGLLDQRTSANEYRHSQAFAMAEAGLEQAAAFLRVNPQLHRLNVDDGWAPCVPGAPFPCDDPTVTWVFGTVDNTNVTSAVVELLDSDEDPAMPQAESFLVRTVDDRLVGFGRGASDDGTGTSIVEVAFGVANIISPGEIPPLMAPTADLSGNFNIVANPNGGGPGVPISVWAIDPNTGSGVSNWKTCDHGDFRDSGDVCMDTYSGSESWQGCRCSESRSVPKSIQADIVIADVNEFPNPFVYVFGDPTDANNIEALKDEVKTMAEASGLVLPNCVGLDTAFNDLVGSALVWIEGSCDIKDPIGSRDKPIILVVEKDLKINGNIDLWGLVVGGFLDESAPANKEGIRVWPMKTTGTPVIHGSLVSEGPTDITAGTYYQVYDQGVFDSLLDDSINTQLTKLSYSWRDFRP